jgi:pimeloyl-ACP methyl ester carboxylesterase
MKKFITSDLEKAEKEHDMSQVISKDGTKIVYDKVGQGPSVVFVEGATATRSSFVELASLLAPNFTVYYHDRRGRGDSSDTLPYSVEREIEDIEVLIDEAGGTAYLYGISSGGALALKAASKLGNKVKKLAIYEVPYDESETGQVKWKEYKTTLNESLQAGKHGDAVTAFMKLVDVPDEMLAGMKQSPFWPELEKVAPTLAYDAACLGEDRKVPIETAKHITVPTLVMDGGGSLQSYPNMRASAEKLAKLIPNVEWQTLEGQTHNVDSKVLAPVLEKFFRG